MKKGLLSLLAVALTVVGCQNYDDQFDELSDQITALSATVQGLSTVADQITALQNTVNGLELTLGADIATIKTAVDALNDSLADVATAADLGVISSTLAGVQADVKELLAANAVINQNIVINNVATLEYVESLISTGPDDPNVIVNGTIAITYDDTPFTSATHLARINAVTDKFATSLKTVTISNTYSPTGDILSFANLAFVDNDLSITGATNLADGDASNDKLRTVTGDLTVASIKGDIDLSLLTSAGDIVVPGGAGVTALKMGSVTAESLSTAGEAKGHLNLVSATIVDGGKSTVSSIVANVATDIDFTAAATVTVNAPKAATIDITGTTLTGDLSITASSATIVKLPAVTSVGGTITTGALAELNLPKLSSTATLSTGAKKMNLDGLKTQKTNGPITAANLTEFKAPLLDVTDVVSVVAATDITFHDFSVGGTGAFNVTVYSLAAKNLTIDGLSATNSITMTKSASVMPALVSMNITGDTATSAPYISTQTNAVSITSDVLTTLTTGGTIDLVSMHDAAKLTSLTTKGYTRHFELIGAAELEEASLGHAHIEGSDAASLRIHNAAKLKAVAPAVLNEVGHVTLTSLPKMTSLNLSTMSILPILGTYTITISNTGLTGSYAIASEATTTTAAFTDKIYSDDLMTLKPLMDLAAASAVVTYVFDGDVLSAVTTRTFDSEGNPGAASTGNSTDTLQALIITQGPEFNAASAISSPLSEEDFAHVAAQP
jgi:hypothetical protein